MLHGDIHCKNVTLNKGYAYFIDWGYPKYINHTTDKVYPEASFSKKILIYI